MSQVVLSMAQAWMALTALHSPGVPVGPGLAAAIVADVPVLERALADRGSWPREMELVLIPRGEKMGGQQSIRLEPLRETSP